MMNVNVRNAWRELTAWCAIGLAAVGLIDPACCSAAAWDIDNPTPGEIISNAVDRYMDGDGTNDTTKIYRARLYTDPGGVMEGDDAATFGSYPMHEHWSGHAKKVGVTLYTSGSAILQVWEKTPTTAGSPKAAVTVTVS